MYFTFENALEAGTNRSSLTGLGVIVIGLIIILILHIIIFLSLQLCLNTYILYRYYLIIAYSRSSEAIILVCPHYHGISLCFIFLQQPHKTIIASY